MLPSTTLLYKHRWNPSHNHYRLIYDIFTSVGAYPNIETNKAVTRYNHRPAKINTCMHMLVLRIEAVQSQLGKDVYQPINRGNWDEFKECEWPLCF